MKKRLNGEGSWGKKTIHGYEYYYYRDENGKYTYAKSTGLLKKKLSTAEKSPKINSQKTTFGEYIRYWLYDVKYNDIGIGIQSTTFDAYEDALKTRFFDAPIANRQAHAVTYNDINNYLKDLAITYRHSTIKKTWNVLGLAIRDNAEIFPNLNLYKVKIPSEANVIHKRKNVQFTSNEDMDILYNEAFRKTGRNTPYYGTGAYMLVFIMYSGLRLSEAIGLKWKNVNLKDGIISIVSITTRVKERNSKGQQIGYKIIDKDPKTADSIRTIPYRERAGEILRLMHELNPHHSGNDYVFTTQNDRPFGKRTVERTLKRMLNNSDVSCKDYTPHSLRHGYGSILYQLNVPLKTISELLGHSDITITANIYVGVNTDTLKDALRLADNPNSQ